MITRFGLLVYVWVGLLISAAPAEDETPRSNSANDLAAQVTIPYQEFRRLLDAATTAGKPEDTPDLPGAVTRAVIKLSFDLAHPSGEAEFDIDSFGHKWGFIPFFGLDFPITNVGSESAVVIPHDGVLCLLTNRPGSTKVTLAFDLPSALVTGRAESVSLRMAPVTSGQLEFGNLPAGKRILVDGTNVDVTKPLAISAQGGEIRVKCVTDAPDSPTDWSQITQTVATPTLESIQIESHIHLSGATGSGLSAVAELPVAASKLDVIGADLQPAQINASGSGHRKITLTWETSGILDRNIIVRYELLNPEPGRQWQVESPHFGKELDPQTSLTVITSLPGSTIQSDNGHSGSDISQLPYWMQSKLVTPDFYLVRAVTPVTASIRMLPVLKPDNARILRASYQTGLVPDGSLKCEAGFKIEYRNAFSWRFRLPDGSALLDCQVNSNPTSPILKADGELELSIPAPANSENVKSLMILISYTARGAKFEPVEGKLALSLPSTTLFVEQLEWRLSLPDNYEATAFEGNVEPGSSDNTSIVFTKRLVRAETPNLEVYYRRKERETTAKTP
jgi:hypothetical protein